MDGGEEEVITRQHSHELQAGRHHRLHILIHLIDAGIHLSGVGTWCLEHHEDSTWLVVDIGDEVVTDRTNLHIGDITQMQQMTAVAGTQHDVIKLLDSLQGTFVFHRILVGILRLLSQGTRGRDETLSSNGGKHIVGIQSVLCHHVRLHPDTQGVGVTQTHHITHTSDTHQSWLDIDINIVRDEVIVVLTVDTPNGTYLQDVTLLLHHLYTDLCHIGRQQCRCSGDAVLYVHRRHVRVGTLLEVHLDTHISSRCRLGGHVGHVRHTIDRLLKGLDDRLHHRVRVSTGIGG